MFDSDKFVFISNNLFLDFANTMVRRNDKPFDLLQSFRDFLTWSVGVELIGQNQGEKFLNDKEKEKQFREIIEFRDVLREIAKASVKGKKVKESLIDKVNEKLKLQKSWTEIQLDKEGFKKIEKTELKSASDILTIIAGSVADFLAENKSGNLRICESEDCILYFHDQTKNHSRRWCSMESCGNRAKANAFYHRKKAQNS
jgi:predicted RNA-binding Zn ribbon-like protein